MKLTHQYIIEIETDGNGDVDHDYLTGVLMKLLSPLCRSEIPEVGDVKTTVNTVVYETSYPTPKPEDL